jgi:hypothetical protein
MYEKNVLSSSLWGGGGGIAEAQSKPIGMVSRKYGKNEDTCGSERSHCF